MRTANQKPGIPIKTLGLLVAILLAFFVSVPNSEAASLPAPGLKALAVTLPTNLPPRQSEVQRLTVEAEGGSYRLLSKVGEGKVSTVFHQATISTEAGSSVATILSGESLELGARVVGAGFDFSPPTIVLDCSSDCVTPGSTVTLSSPSTETHSVAEGGEVATATSRQATAEEGSYSVGELIRVVESGILQPGSVVTAVSGSALSLSAPLSSESPFLPAVVSIFQQTAPIAYDAQPPEVQSALDGLPAYGAGSVTVSGGPGGDAAHPYFLAFGGKFQEQDVQQLEVDETGLIGPHRFTKLVTTVPGGNGTGDIAVLPSNIGALPTSGTITAKVGPLPAGIVAAGRATGNAWKCSGGAGEATITCTTAHSFAALVAGVGNPLRIPIETQATTPLDTTVPVELSGGGSAPSTYPLHIVVSAQQASSGVAAAWAGSFEADGSPSTQAGGHPYTSAAYFIVNSLRVTNGNISPVGDSKNVMVDLPQGLIGNPLAGPRCPQSNLSATPLEPSNLCTNSSTVGNLIPLITGPFEALQPTAPRVFDDVPPEGAAAEFSITIEGFHQSVLANVKAEDDFGVRLTAPNNPNLSKLYGAFAAFEGVPAFGSGRALLANPTNCAESAATASEFRIATSTYQEPTNFGAFGLPQPAVTGCENLKFEAKNPATGQGQLAFSFTPRSEDGTLVGTGSTPVGAEAHLHIDQGGLLDPAGLVTPHLKRAVIKLPEGLVLNPSSANGLQSCSEAQIGYKGNGFPMPTPIRFKEAQPSCLDGSKLGTAEIKTPLLDSPLVGEVFLANQEENPFGSLLAIYLVVNDPHSGVLIKLAGEVQADPFTGRLTAVFDNNPQLPFEDLYLHFRGGGPQSLFATSEVCGSFPTEGELTPWSAPESGPPAETTSSVSISVNCAPSPGARPFSPSFQAGTTGPNAGDYSPLVVNITRKDGEQELKTLDFTLPKGLLGRIAGIPYCSEASIRRAESTSGKAEQGSASCPAASQVGTVDVAAGVGSKPFHVGGKVYLAGPYRGAPLSALVVTPAVAGPLDLGDVVVRTPLYIDPETAQITAKSDPLPTILRGIPLKLRSVAINLNRPNFTLNPTNCEPMVVTASIGGSSGAIDTPSNRFQVGGCKSLKFKPKLKISLKGSTARTGHPGLKAVLSYPKKGSYSNIARAQVNLPHSEFLAQGNLNKTCTKPVLLEGKCPASSIYGRAKAWTPLLEKPLQGPVYLVGGYGYKLPALVADLEGQIRVVLKGKVDTGKNKGIRNTFEAVPDAPVSRFVLQLKGGRKYGLLENSENLCAKPQRAIARFTAQNGLVRQADTRIANKCGKKSTSKGKKAGHGAGKQ